MIDAKTNPPLREVYTALFKRWGPQGWWPAQSRFEVMIGAILTQNTSWTNVERTIANLKLNGYLSLEKVHSCSAITLAKLIRSSGTHHVKAKRIKNLTEWLYNEYAGNIGLMFKRDTPTLRRQLLHINGIGKETADCILLYAGKRPVFVVDTYTRRVLQRHGWIDDKYSYDEIAARFEQLWGKQTISKRAHVFNEYHALVVKLAKEHCLSRPDCRECPLEKWPCVINYP